MQTLEEPESGERRVGSAVGSLADWVDRYDRHYMIVRRFAPRTRIEYARDLLDLVSFLAEQCHLAHIENVSRQHLRRYLDQLADRGLAVPARRRRVAAIRSFFTFLTQRGVLPHDPARSLLPPAREAETLRVLSEAECAHLRQVCAANARDAAMIALFLGTGLRVSELAALSLTDVVCPPSSAFGRDQVRITGRQYRVRIVPLDTGGCRAVQHYLSARPHAVSPSLFLSRLGRPLTVRGVRLIVSDAYRKAAITDASVHTLRHTFAVRQLRCGMPLATLADVLGHRAVKTVQPYAQLIER
jgi:site-specific recombinase XerD